MKILIYYGCMLITVLSLASCSKSSKDDSPKSKSIEEIIPSNLLTKLKGKMNIYDGDTPPSIDGCYLISPAFLVSSTLSDDSYGDKYCDNYIKFTDQNKNNVVTFNSYESYSNQVDTSSSNLVSIRGAGNFFTAYFTENTVDAIHNNTTATAATVISGEKLSSGIKNIRYAFLMISKNDPDSVYVPINSIRIFADEDSIVENATWPTTKVFRIINICKNKIKLRCMYKK